LNSNGNISNSSGQQQNHGNTAVEKRYHRISVTGAVKSILKPNLCGHIFSIMTTSKSIRTTLIREGFLKILIDIVLGDKVPKTLHPLIALLLSPTPNANKTSTSSHFNVLDDLNEMDRELWWTSFILLVELTTGFRDAKLELDKLIGMKVYFQFLLQLSKYLNSNNFLPDYLDKVISDYILELSLEKCQIHLSLPPFIETSIHFPRQLQLSNENSNNSSSNGYPQRGISISSTIVNSSSILAKSFPRGGEDQDILQQLASINCCNMSIFSSHYFVHDQLQGWIFHTFNPQFVQFEAIRNTSQASVAQLMAPSFILLPGSSAVITSTQEQRNVLDDYSPQSLSRDSESSAALMSLAADLGRLSTSSVTSNSAVQVQTVQRRTRERI
jgi:hypothetical protein